VYCSPKLEALNGGGQRWFKRSSREKKLVAGDDDDNNNNKNNNNNKLVDPVWHPNLLYSAQFGYFFPCYINITVPR
jgi:hypothetical protein